MNSFPDFAAHGYQVIKELGHNSEGGRFTYLAKRFADHIDVVVKQFQFATRGAGWDGYETIKKEIQSLQGLNHRGIPKYLDKFETDNGYCLVTEYFPANTLVTVGSFTPDQIKQIAVQLLEILVYLQKRIPPVIHRDIKPDNILVDDNFNVYLIDFGAARVGDGTTKTVAGAFGFMAPEQIYNRITKASDLYGLGLTLICLIGAVKSNDIGKYVDEDTSQLDQSKIAPKLKDCSQTFINWLFKMAAPLSKRFADANTALEALKPLYVVRVPEVKFFKDGVEFDPSKDVLEFKATKLGEKLTQTITLVNSISETLLEGHWEVAPHPNDPPHSPDNHAWISFGRKKFISNRVDCQITIDTIELIAKAKGKRKLILHLNTNQENYAFLIQVETAALPIKTYKFSIGFITHFLIIPFLIGIIPILLHITKLVSLSSISSTYSVSGLVLVSVGIFIVVCLLNFISSLIDRDLKKILTLTGSLIMGLSIMCIYFLWIDSTYEKSNLPQFYAWLGTYRISIYGSAIASASFLGYLLFYSSIDHQRKIAAYRCKEENLIKP